MANYKIGDIVRLTRKSIGMSQEELAFEAGVATETISRIESGKHKVTQATYQKVMEPLNRFTNRSYAVCTGKDIGIIEEKELLESATVKFEYKKAVEYLEDLKDKADDTIINRQYILREEALLDYYYNHTIDAETLVERLEEVLRLTVDNYQEHMDYSKYQENGYPYTEQELLTLMNLAGAYDECGLSEKAEKISYMLLDCLDSGYMCGDKIDNFELVIKRNLTFFMQSQGRYEESLSLLEEILEDALKIKYGLMIVATLYDITWNMVKLNEISGIEKYSWAEIKRKKRQVYYIAAARKDNHIKKLAKNSYERLFHEEIEV